MRRILAVALLSLLLAGTARADTLVLRGATVLPQEGAAVEDADVVLEGEKVVALGPRGKVALPGGARVVAVEGFLIPGLIDAHAHLADADLFPDLYVAHGVLGVRDLGNRLELVRGLERSIREGRREGPEIAYVGPILDGNPPSWPAISEVLEDPAAVPAVLDRLQASGVQAFKVYESLRPDVYEAIVAEGRRRGVPVIGHVPPRVGVVRCIEAGQDVLEHLDHFASELNRSPVRGFLAEISGWTDVDPEKERALIAKLVEHRTRLDPTCVVVKRLSSVLRGVKPDCPEARFVPRLLKDSFWAFFAGQPRADASTDEAHEKSALAVRAFLKRAHAAGVPILAGSDTPNPYVVPGVSLQEEVELLAAALGPEAALRSATLENARALGRADLGRIAPGALANLVLLRADPRRDARAVRAIESVVLRGKVLTRADLDAKLDSVAARVKKLDEKPVAGFASLEGPLAGPGKALVGGEVRLEGRLGDFPPAYWARLAELPGEDGGRVLVLRSQAAMPLPARLEETLTLDRDGRVAAFTSTRTMMGDVRRLDVTRGETTFRVRLSRNGTVETELAVPQDEHLATTGELLLCHLAASSGLEEGASLGVTVRLVDFDRLVVAPPSGWRVLRFANPVRDSADPRAAGRHFVATGPDEQIRRVALWVDGRGLPLGVEVKTAFGPFATKRVPVPGAPPAAPRKKYY